MSSLSWSRKNRASKPKTVTPYEQMTDKEFMAALKRMEVLVTTTTKSISRAFKAASKKFKECQP